MVKTPKAPPKAEATPKKKAQTTAPAKVRTGTQTITWTALNDMLRECDEATATGLLDQAQKLKWPQRHVLRIQGRFNKLRKARELAALLK